MPFHDTFIGMYCHGDYRMKSKKELLMDMLVVLGKVEHKASLRADKDLSPFGLSRSQFSALVHLSQMNPGAEVPISSLIEILNMNQPGVTKVVKSLLELGYVITTDSDDDKRVKLLRLTPLGRETCNQTFASLGESLTEIYKSWSKSDITSLTELLKKLNDTLSN